MYIFCFGLAVICILLCIAGYGAGQQKCKPGRMPAQKIDSAYLTLNKQDINTTVIVQLVTEECYKVNSWAYNSQGLVSLNYTEIKGK